MPWSRLRVNRSSDGSLRRHSTIDPIQLRGQSVNDFAHEANAMVMNVIPTPEPPPTAQGLAEPTNVSVDGASIVRPSSPALRERNPRQQRFSMLKFRHASDSQLSKTAREQANRPTHPMPGSEYLSDAALTIVLHDRNPDTNELSVAPAIITTAPTAPTIDPFEKPSKKKSTFTFPRRRKTQEKLQILSTEPRASLSDRGSQPRLSDSNAATESARASRVTFDQLKRSRDTHDPPAYGDDINSTLALPIFPPRLSESSRSEGSVGEHGLYATTTTTHTVSTTTTFFRLPRRNKQKKGPLFPLPVKIPPSEPLDSSTLTPRVSTSGRPSGSPSRHSPTRTCPVTAARSPYPVGSGSNGLPSPLPSPSHKVHLPSSLAFATRRDSTTSVRSGRSSPVLNPPARLGQRGRSSTKNSKFGDEDQPTPPLPQSARTSSSTTGRASLGGLFNLSRLRSEPNYTRQSSSQTGAPGTPISNSGSKHHSFSLTREPAVVPERQEGDTPAKYLARLEEAVSRGVVAIILSKSDDEFSRNVLRSYMRSFIFFGDPLDMSIRKLLMEVELPKETQQIDRVLQAFANRYHECNPGIYASPGQCNPYPS